MGWTNGLQSKIQLWIGVDSLFDELRYYAVVFVVVDEGIVYD